jgi:hypothetical protein
LFDDYIVFSLPAKSKAAGQSGDALAAQKRFMQIAAEYRPCSLGDALHGGSLRPDQSKSIFGHWGKRNKPNFKKVLEGMSKAGTMAAVFDNRANAEAFVKRIKEEDLGLSVNISSSIEKPRMPASSPASRATPSPIRWALRKWATTQPASRPSCCRPCAATACSRSTWRRR